MNRTPTGEIHEEGVEIIFVTRTALTQFFYQLAQLTSSGLPLLRALSLQRGQIRNRRFRLAVSEVEQTVSAGGTLARAMEKYPSLFTPLQVSLVNVGEQTGTLPEAFRSIAGYIERDITVRRKLTTNMIYPIFLLHAIIIIPGVPALVLSGFIPFLHQVGFSLLVFYGIAGLIWIAAGLRRRLNWLRSTVDLVVIYLPVFGTLLRKLALARFTHTLSVLYNAGVEAVRALEIAGQAAGNIVIKRFITSSLSEVKKGKRWSTIFARCRFFPPMVINMLAAGEESGRVGEMLEKVSDYYEQESEETIRRLVRFVPFLIYLMIVFYIGYFIVTNYLKIFSAYDSIDILEFR